jgi:hypothetical protein
MHTLGETQVLVEMLTVQASLLGGPLGVLGLPPFLSWLERCQSATPWVQLAAILSRVMGPPVKQGDGATREGRCGDLRRVMGPGLGGFPQGHGSTSPLGRT